MINEVDSFITISQPHLEDLAGVPLAGPSSSSPPVMQRERGEHREQRLRRPERGRPVRGGEAEGHEAQQVVQVGEHYVPAWASTGNGKSSGLFQMELGYLPSRGRAMAQ